MATYTTNIGLTLPDGTENVSRQVLNSNFYNIDYEFGLIETLDASALNTSIKKINRIVCGTIVINATATSGSYGTLESEFYPVTWVRAVCRTDDATPKFGAVNINPSTGAITYKVPSTGTYYCSFAYIASQDDEEEEE